MPLTIAVAQTEADTVCAKMDPVRSADPRPQGQRPHRRFKDGCDSTAGIAVLFLFLWLGSTTCLLLLGGVVRYEDTGCCQPGISAEACHTIFAAAHQVHASAPC